VYAFCRACRRVASTHRLDASPRRIASTHRLDASPRRIAENAKGATDADGRALIENGIQRRCFQRRVPSRIFETAKCRRASVSTATAVEHLYQRRMPLRIEMTGPAAAGAGAATTVCALFFWLIIMPSISIVVESMLPLFFWLPRSLIEDWMVERAVETSELLEAPPLTFERSVVVMVFMALVPLGWVGSEDENPMCSERADPLDPIDRALARVTA
jgi:hypothetical protein